MQPMIGIVIDVIIKILPEETNAIVAKMKRMITVSLIIAVQPNHIRIMKIISIC